MKLRTLIEAVQQNLSDFQKGLLGAITQSATTDQAYETAVGSQNSMAALHQLQVLGYVVINGKTVGLTATGRQAAIQNNLVDQSNNLTQEGRTQVQNYLNNKKEYINAD